ncbi:uncharacterized protein L203_104210 [Cryptococcus depauperatus CBS 7841]|uniref:DNA repair and recombination protein RAD52 n=1 Tax=Cryptococcus depauperatus CBS 7841 TaxID=1295531 RepID=A0AAJ8JV32_9TREE
MSPSARLVESYKELQSTGSASNRSLLRPNRSVPATAFRKPSLHRRSIHEDKSTVTMDVNESVSMNQSASSINFGNTSFGNSTFGVTNQQGVASQWSEERIHQLQARLARKLGPEYVTQRPGPGGSTKLSYIEGWKVINLANEVFGFNGWTSSIVSLSTDFIDVNKEGRVSVNVTAIIRITLKDGTYHEDVGCGQGENVRGKGAALDKAQKEAVTDATKRALRTFGNVLGNCLYDKEYTKQVVKMQVPPPKFNHDELERRAEFVQEAAPGLTTGPSPASSVPQHMSNAPKQPLPTERILPPRNIIPQPLLDPVGTPIKSIHGNESLQASPDEFEFDENFDAEFMDFGSDSLLAQLDDQCLQAGPGPITKQENAQPDSKPSMEPDAPVYQHRHRPGMPRSSSDNQLNDISSKASLPLITNNHLLNTSNAIKFSLEKGMSSNRMTGIPSIALEGMNNIAKPSDQAQKSPLNSRLMGNSSVYNSPSGPYQPSTRAQAIASALHIARGSASPQPTRIPSGGIDAAAQRASRQLITEGVRLGLDENHDVDPNLSLGGFSSARGVKRQQGENRRSASPTKSSGAGLSVHSGDRTTLGELPIGMENDWGAKKSRMS